MRYAPQYEFTMTVRVSNENLNELPQVGETFVDSVSLDDLFVSRTEVQFKGTAVLVRKEIVYLDEYAEVTLIFKH